MEDLSCCSEGKFFSIIRWTRACKHGIYQPLIKLSLSIL
uniref:Uncharacterized protein n=1 Tax=Arundo donax TaxID=35708 RepID=A0A0A9EBM1_ARUDO